jgi:hypothetical protein
MYLGNPLLPIKITSAVAEENLRKEIKKKNWYDFELAPLKLTLVPYFLFNYHYYIENDNEGKNVIKSTVHGVLAVDGHDIKIRLDLVDLLKHNWKDTMQEIPRGEFNERYCNIDKKDQNEVLQLKTAQHFNVPKSNVVVSEPRKLLLPEYWAIAKIDGKKYNLTVNAVDGTIIGMKDIPERQKGYIELTKETIAELKNPKNWIKYSAEVIEEGLSHSVNSNKKNNGSKLQNQSGGNSKLNFSLFESKAVLIVIILLAILLIVASVFRLKFF